MGGKLDSEIHRGQYKGLFDGEDDWVGGMTKLTYQKNVLQREKYDYLGPFFLQFTQHLKMLPLQQYFESK